MKRTLIGFGLLFLLLAGGILADCSLSGHNEAVASQLDTAARQAMVGDLRGAILTAEDAREYWQRRWTANAALTDHAPMEQVDSGFAQLQVYSDSGDHVAFAAVCTQMATQVQAIADACEARLRNIL